ncbi:hypothetical protein J3B02_001718 [Coemansia erecta]|uniref:Uncharacterized protein n=1 Tax=Coemansia asiatica TaxID=1052880 RepID=A0A9W7XH18_9FUNG|nr:hypothetical protein LPJ64_005523 [Coemansia asiatica]KAJ2856231.1 hypothetical protein J3B02_001718 [Coemansia erecta]KAJ2878005.1 hypothetical protein FB639_003541 [Coemansia asiatica]
MIEITDPPTPNAEKQASARVSQEQIKSLRAAVETLECEYTCLSRIREPLGLVGGYWNMDTEVIARIAAGSLSSAIRGITKMCFCFNNILASSSLPPSVSYDIALLVRRARTWVMVNAITPTR